MATPQLTRDEIIDKLSQCGTLSYDDMVNLLYSIIFFTDGTLPDNFISRFTGKWDPAKAALGKYDIDYYVSYSDRIYKSTIDNNASTPGASLTWIIQSDTIIGGIGFRGNATPSNPATPQTPVNPEVWIGIPGTYPNFGGVTITGQAGFLVWSGTAWSAINITIDLADYTKTVDFLPVKAAIDLLSSAIIVDGDGNTNLVDGAGNIGLQVTRAGVLRVVSIITSLLTAMDMTTTTLTIGNTVISANDDYLIVFTDGNGWIGYAITKDLKVLQYNPATVSVEPIPESDVRVKPFYGQSLSLGTGSTADTVTTTPGVFTFNGGPIVPDSDTGYASLRLSTQITVECPSEASTRMARQTMIDKGLLPAGGSFIQDYILYNPGFGGLPIEQLRKGSTHYTRLLKGMTFGKSLSDAAFKSNCMPALEWMQGEGNILNLSTKAFYKAQMIALYNELNIDAKATFGQLFDIKFLTYQTASHLHYGGSTDVALAQLENCLADINMYMVAAMYPYDYGADTLHMANAEQYQRVGALFGYIYTLIVDLGVNWKPIYVKSYKITGQILELKFHVPVKPLVLDTTIVVDPGNYGFRIFNGATELTINSVTLTKPDTVKIVVNEAVLSGYTLTYAINGTGANTGRTLGPRGCLRDSQGETVIYDPAGKNYKLHNWTPIFSKTL